MARWLAKRGRPRAERRPDGATSNAGGASAQPLLDLGLLREMFAPRADGAGAANDSMGGRDIE
jgi:hypothetical protein